MRRISAAVLPVLFAFSMIPKLAFAQAGLYAEPSVVLRVDYDDNVLATSEDKGSLPVDPDAEPAAVEEEREPIDDVVTRLGAGLQVGWKSKPFTLLLGYDFDLEIFASESDFNEAPAAQSATLGLRYLPTRNLSVTLDASLRETFRPGELNREDLAGGESLTAPETEVGEFAEPDLSGNSQVELGRERAESSFVGAGFELVLGPRTTANVDGSTRFSDFRGEKQTVFQGGSGLRFQWTPRTSLSLRGTVRRFEFEEPNDEEATPVAVASGAEALDDGNPDSTSGSVNFGFDHELTSQLSLGLQGGPRFSSGAVDADAGAKLNYAFQRGLASVGYRRGESTSVDRSGVTVNDNVSASLSWVWTPRFDSAASLLFSRSRGDRRDTDGFSAQVSFGYRVSRWVNMSLGYDFRFQESRANPEPDDPPQLDQELTRNIVFVSFSAAQPFRVY